MIDGSPQACPVEIAGERLSWGLTLPADDGPGTFTVWTRGPDEVDAPAELPADAFRVGPSAWQVEVPTYRCAGCDVIDGLQDGLTLTCAPADGPPGRMRCGGSDGAQTGWDLRLAETP